MSAHTPGPWKWGDGWAIADRIGSVYSRDGENESIEKYMDMQLFGAANKPIIPIRIDHYQMEYDGDPITLADRALIASAPDLLAALESAPNPGYGQEAQRWMDEEYWPWWSKVRAAALKKAQGGGNG